MESGVTHLVEAKKMQKEDAQMDVLRTDAHTHRDRDHCYLYCAALEIIKS